MLVALLLLLLLLLMMMIIMIMMTIIFVVADAAALQGVHEDLGFRGKREQVFYFCQGNTVDARSIRHFFHVYVLIC